MNKDKTCEEIKEHLKDQNNNLTNEVKFYKRVSLAIIGIILVGGVALGIDKAIESDRKKLESNFDSVCHWVYHDFKDHILKYVSDDKEVYICEEFTVSFDKDGLNNLGNLGSLYKQIKYVQNKVDK